MSNNMSEYMQDNEFNETIKQMIKWYGADEMKVICMEECAELIQAISKSLRGKPDSRDNLLEEMADVVICLRALKIMYDITPRALDKWIESKTLRNAKRLKIEKGKKGWQ